MSNNQHPVLQAYHQGLRIYKREQPTNLWVRRRSPSLCAMEGGFLYPVNSFNFLQNPHEWSIHSEDINLVNLVKENTETIDTLPDILDINGVKYQKIQ